MQWGFYWPLKNGRNSYVVPVIIATEASPNLYLDQPIIKADARQFWRLCLISPGSYPTDGPNATRLGLCSRLNSHTTGNRSYFWISFFFATPLGNHALHFRKSLLAIEIDSGAPINKKKSIVIWTALSPSIISVIIKEKTNWYNLWFTLNTWKRGRRTRLNVCWNI